MTTVAGRCPGCGKPSLHLAAGGHVTCGRLDCPDPGAADAMLHLGHCHVVEFDALRPHRFHLEHPVTCRLNGRRLLDCHVDAALAALSGPPRPPGRWAVELVDGELRFREALA